MITTWYETLKFKENPLDIRPNPNLIGLEEEEEQLMNHILKEEVCFLNGLTGSGKTSMLNRLQSVMKGHSFVYLDAQDLPENFNLEDELKKKRTFFDMLRLKNFPSKKPVLIIDEFQVTNPNLILEARSKWESTENQRIKSIVIAQISKRLKNVSASFKERLGNRIVTLKTLDDEDMSKILKVRLSNNKRNYNYYKKLSKEAVDLLAAAAGGNPRRLLEYTDLIFDFHHRRFGKNNPIMKDDYEVTYYATKEILEVNGINVKGFVLEAEKEAKKPAKKVKISFQKFFTPLEQDVLKFLSESDPLTIVQLAKKKKLSIGSAKNIVNSLRQKRGVIIAGKKGKEKLWKITPHIKRVMVQE